MFYLKKRRKQMIALCLSAALSVGSLTAYAATEYWNDASTKPMVETKTPISDNTNWEQWKAGWDNLKTNYEQVALTPGADFSKLNFGWYSKEKTDKAMVRIADNKEMKNAKEFVAELQGVFFKLNVVYAKETILKEFEGVGFTFKRDYDFVANNEEVERFYMVGVSKIENEDEKRTEIQFTILNDGTVVTDSNYIPEDIHKLADEAMLKIDSAFGTQRREGIEIKRKEVQVNFT